MKILLNLEFFMTATLNKFSMNLLEQQIDETFSSMLEESINHQDRN